MQRQLSPPQADVSDGKDDLSAKIAAWQRDFDAQVRSLEDELKRKVTVLRTDLESKIARETADWNKRQSARQRQQSPANAKAQSRPYSTPRVRALDTEEEETKPKEAVRTALQRLQESKVKLNEYQTLLRTPTRTPQSTSFSLKSESMPKQFDTSELSAKRPRAVPLTDSKQRPRAEDLPLRPKSLYERILALQKKP